VGGRSTRCSLQRGDVRLGTGLRAVHSGSTNGENCNKYSDAINDGQLLDHVSSPYKHNVSLF
jgi:hypothetical protein